MTKIPKDYAPPAMPAHLKGLYTAKEWRTICWSDKCGAERLKENLKKIEIKRKNKDGGG